MGLLKRKTTKIVSNVSRLIEGGENQNINPIELSSFGCPPHIKDGCPLPTKMPEFAYKSNEDQLPLTWARAYGKQQKKNALKNGVDVILFTSRDLGRMNAAMYLNSNGNAISIAEFRNFNYDTTFSGDFIPFHRRNSDPKYLRSQILLLKKENASLRESENKGSNNISKLKKLIQPYEERILYLEEELESIKDLKGLRGKKGDKGPKGDQGEPGPKGDPGGGKSDEITGLKDMKDSISILEKAVKLDPVKPSSSQYSGIDYYLNRNYREIQANYSQISNLNSSVSKIQKSISPAVDWSQDTGIDLINMIGALTARIEALGG